MNELLQIKAEAAPADADLLTLFFSERIVHGWQEEILENGNTLFTVHIEDTSNAEDILQGLAASFPKVQVARASVENQEWALAWREFFTPVEAGETFVVLPPWLKDDAPEGLTPIIIEPKTAFGTGHHGTTALCLTAAAKLTEAGRITSGGSFLDLGTGSGILGIGCCLTGLTGIGLDIDPLAIENAVENREINSIPEKDFSLAVGSLDALADEQTFDVVLANILAGPLKDMAADIIKRVKPGGCLVLSGILNEQADSVAETYIALGLPKPEYASQGEWTALTWDKLN